MSTTYKNIVATVTGLALVFALAFALVRPTQAAALSQSQIDAIINLLVSFGADQATINNVRAALTGQPTDNTGSETVSSGTCTPMVFTMNHKMGDKGGEVRNIQKFLNNHGFTVATYGPGSPGNETDYFGPATKAAVIRFQEAYASEILAPVGLTRGTGYWGNSTRAKANAMEQARCAQQNQNNNNNNQDNQDNNQQAADELTVVAAAQPPNSLAPAGAVNVPFTRFTLTAGANDVTVSGVKVKLQGMANRTNFSSVVLLDENGMQVGRTRVLQSDYTATVGETFTIPAGQSKTFTVAANIANTVNSGEVASFAVVEVMANKPVNGSLPIVGASYTLNNTLNIATVSLGNGANRPTITQEEIGTTNVYLGSVRVTNNSSNEDVVLKSIRFYQAGSVASSDLANVKIVVDGNEYPAQVTSDGKYYYATFGSGITIPRGLSKDVDIKGDIVSGVNRTIQFQVYEASDVIAQGATYGYGAPITGTTFPYDVAASVITIKGTTLNSLSRSNEAPAANIPPAAPNTVLGAFELDLAGEGIDVSTLKITANLTGTPSDETDAITNVTLVDQNGRVLAGPVDFTDTDTGTPGTIEAEFSGVTFNSGKTVVFVKGQLSSTVFSDGDTIQLTTDAANWTGVRGVQSGTSVTLSGSATMNTMTVRTPKVTLVTAASPNSSLVAGATNVVFAEGEVDASTSGDDIRLTNITIESAASASTTNAGLDNVKIYADLNDDGTYETLIGSAQSFDGLTATEELTYALNPSLEVEKGKKVKIAVIGDIASGTTGNTRIYFKGGSAVGVITAVTATVDTAGNGITRTIAANGDITVTYAGKPTKSALLDATASNNAEQAVLEFKVSADNIEDMQIEKITITQAGTNNNEAVLSYVFTDGTDVWTLTNTGGVTTTIDMTANPIVVPAGSYKTITVKVRTNDIDGTAITNEDKVQVDLGVEAVEARGVQSQTVVKAPTTTAITANDHAIYEAYPNITVKDSGASLTLNPSSKMEVARFTFTNEGDKDIDFVNANADELIIEIVGIQGGAAQPGIKFVIEDGNGNELCSGLTNNTPGYEAATCDFATNSLTIAPGSSEEVVVYVDASAYTSTGDSLYARIKDEDGTVKYSIEGTQVHTTSSYFIEGDVNGPTYVRP